MPIEALLHDSNQDYSSDIWPVGVIMLQLVAKKLSIFNGVKLHAKINGIRNDYFITNLIELANFFGRQVIVQCRKLGYDLQLPKGIETVEFSDIAVM